MAALAGCLFFDGRPTEDECSALIATLQPMAPDGVSVHTEPGFLILHGAFDVWAGERFAQQPARSASGLVATWDGRLDNRDDLLLRLGGGLANDTSDAAIALSTFERWGIEGLGSLIGDWSLSVWDARHRTLHLARDYMGVRPLYYFADSKSVMWSSSLGELATRANRLDAMDEAFVARFMALRFSTDVTPYQGIRGVPTATCVSFSPQGAETRQRFWRLEPGIIRYRDKRQYEEHLRALWMEAVGARLRADGTVWAELSGGLDSSSVVCMADTLIKAGRVPASDIQPFSYVTLESPEGDERRFIAEVEERTGRRSHILGVEEHQALSADSAWVTPLAPQGIQVASLQCVSDHGGRLVLSGRMGDTVMGCETDNSLAVFDDFADGNVAAALANIRLWCRACRRPFIDVAWTLVREGLIARPLDMGASVTGPHQGGVAVLTDNLRAMLQRPCASLRLAPEIRRAQRRHAASVLGYSLQGRLQWPIEPCSVAYSYPFGHRPLLEYALAIPGAELSAPGQTRFLMRRAFGSLVPARVLRRVSKGYYPPGALRAIRPLAAALLPVRQLEVIQRGWLDAQRLDAAIRLLVDGAGGTGEDVQLALQLERWLKSRDRRGPAATPQRKEVITNALLKA